MEGYLRLKARRFEMMLALFLHLSLGKTTEYQMLKHATAFQATFDQMSLRLDSERPNKYIKVGDEVLPLKTSDSYFMSMVMGYFMVVKKQEPEDACTTAFNLLLAQISGDPEKEKVSEDYNVLCMEWHYLMYVKDPETAESLRLKSEKYIKDAIIQFGFDIPEDKALYVVPKENSVREFLAERDQRLKDEKPILMIDLDTRKAPLKASDIQLISMIMAFTIKYAHRSEEDALHYSILTFVLLHDGTEQEKRHANETVDSASKWSLENRGDSIEGSTFQLYCSSRIKEYFGIAPNI